jgi:hypothetical protein
MGLRNRVFQMASTPNVNQDNAEKGPLSSFNLYIPEKEEDQVSFHQDRVKFVYKPLTHILKRGKGVQSRTPQATAAPSCNVQPSNP